MPYVSKWVEPDRFLNHKGVKVFHAYKDDDYEQELVHHFQVGTEDEMLSEDMHKFDVRDLPTYEASTSYSSAGYQAIKKAIDKGGLELLLKAEED